MLKFISEYNCWTKEHKEFSETISINITISENTHIYSENYFISLQNCWLNVMGDVKNLFVGWYEGKNYEMKSNGRIETTDL